MRLWTVILLLAVHAAYAQDGGKPAAKVLTLSDYLEQVKAGSPEARAVAQGASAAELKLNEADTPFSPELYSKYGIFDNRQEPPNSFSPFETRGRVWTLGVRDQTTIGLKADAFFTSTRTGLLGVNPQFIPLNDYEQSQLGLNLTQSLWRDSFGAATRASRDAQRAGSRAEMLKQKMTFKNILLKAENTYWSLVSFNEIVKLQQQNVERARRLRDWSARKAKLRLFDDVDAMQTEASYQQRELDLRKSMNQRAQLIRDFNSLRGSRAEEAETLSPLPTGEFMLKTLGDDGRHMSREDFQAVFEEAKMAGSRAEAARSQLWPQLDLTGGISSNGLDRATSTSYDEAQRGQHPDWNVGIVFSVPLDYSLIGKMSRAYAADARAARDRAEQARFEEDRAWNEVIRKNAEAQDVYQRATQLEKLQTTLVERERKRLLNGRTTTFQVTDAEQNLALVQINRVQAQLELLQIHNLIKTFEERP
jgi:outer membrane protein TolC